MRNIYTFNGTPAQRNFTVADLRARKGAKDKLTMVNPSSPAEAAAAVEAGIDLFTLWDEQVEMVREVAPTTFAGSGMGWEQHATNDDILRAAIKSMERGADFFYTNRSYDAVELLAKNGIPVQAHMGLIPRLSTWVGGLRAIGKTAEEAMELYRTFKRLEDVGCFAVEIECVAEEALLALNDKTSIVTCSLGSGYAGDIIFLFLHDICGEAPNDPKHARAFGDVARLHQQIHSERVEAMRKFRNAVNEGSFPGPKETVHMPAEEVEKLAEALDKL
ncbi:MAG: hydroxymethyltransferase [Rhodobacteraceae bacterium]|nr:hydroxymethyltransferase [Paracoccaceae bacterium]